MIEMHVGPDGHSLEVGAAGWLKSATRTRKVPAGWTPTPSFKRNFAFKSYDETNVAAVPAGQEQTGWAVAGATVNGLTVTGGTLERLTRPIPLPKPDPLELIKALSPPPTPADGQAWALGKRYPAGALATEGGKTWRSRQTHTADAAGWSPTSPGTAALWELVEAPGATAWAAGVTLTMGPPIPERTHNGRRYRLVQAHTTQAGWEPPSVPALWTDIGPA